MKWNVYINHRVPGTKEYRSTIHVIEVPGSHRSDNASTRWLAAKHFKVNEDAVLTLPTPKSEQRRRAEIVLHTPRHGDSTQTSWDKQAILDGMSRALFVNAWAAREEERGRTKGWAGRDIMDLAPRTSSAAKAKARELASTIEHMNGLPITQLYDMAVVGAGSKHGSPNVFGHYLAMQSLGHGVSWFDNHPPLRHAGDERPFHLKLPRIEFYL